jgi:hypothetical protein
MSADEAATSCNLVCAAAAVVRCQLQMREQQLLELDALCRFKGIKLLIVRSYGLMGYMRVSHAPAQHKKHPRD